MTNTNTEKLPDAPEFITVNPGETATADYVKELAKCLSDEQKEFADELIDEIKGRNVNYISEFINEWTDNRVDDRYCDLYEWLKGCSESDEYLGRAISEGFVGTSSRDRYSFFKHMQVAQYLQIDDHIYGELSCVLRYAVAAVASDSHPYISEDQRDEIESLCACDLDTLDDIRNAVTEIFESEEA